MPLENTMIKIVISLILYLSAFVTFVTLGPFYIILSFILPIKLLYKLSRFVSWALLLSMGVVVKIEGKNPKNKNFIYMYNHSSFIDVFLIGYSMKGPCSAIIAKENYKYPIWGTMLKKYRAIPIDRKNKQSAINSIKMAEEIISDGFDVMILPEGTRTLTGNLKRFKKGGFHMAYNTNTSIMPVACIGAFDFKPKNRWTLSPRKVIIRYGKPIESSTYHSMSIEELVMITEDKIKLLSGYKFEDE